MSSTEQTKKSTRKYYCKVVGCGNYSETVSLPKNVDRAKTWLKVAGLGQLVEELPMPLYRRASIKFCRRHFLPTSFLNRKVAEDAVPRLYLPESGTTHHGVLCKNCETVVSDVRYKCIVCQDYDLCKACNNQNVHLEHSMLRITKPVSNVDANTMVQNMHMVPVKSIKTINHLSVVPTDTLSIDPINSDVSSDDEPITKYVSKTQEYDLPEDVKCRISNEIYRVLYTINKGHPKPMPIKQVSPIENKRFNISTQTDEDHNYPEVEFADVNDSDFETVIKSEDIMDMAPESVSVPAENS